MADNENRRIPEDAQGAIEAFLQSYRAEQPVSMTTLMRAARRALRDVSVSDAELADLIAHEAIRSRHSIVFDHGDEGEP